MAADPGNAITETEVEALAQSFAAWADTLTERERAFLWAAMGAAVGGDVGGFNWNREPDFRGSFLSLFRSSPSETNTRSSRTSESPPGSRP